MDKGNTTRGLQQVQKAWQACVQSGGFDSALSSNLRIVSVSEEGEVICQFKVENDHLNVYNGLHGGYISTLIDIGGSLAITYKGGFASGVSTDLSVSFISTATAGDLITVVLNLTLSLNNSTYRDLAAISLASLWPIQQQRY
ncbi:hypothetical protein DSO57_1012657 [Entomophthora muscae]|uniref:Uncharacterized protein n=1 Tax=Entomophthora muscae TaxID=34485 RepID=A0ACC2RWX4_9FUNG|nr:hypothetical protein DSO57_1012657 [Entomophthora muscae]